LFLIGRDAPDKTTGAASTWELCQASLSPEARQRAEYLGLQQHEKVLEHIKRASLCVFPSYAEALPVAWLEAMACAKAVIAYDIGWAPEIIASGDNGMLVQLGNLDSLTDAIVQLLNDGDESKRLGLAARRRIEHEFASDVVAASAIEYYGSVLSGADAGRPELIKSAS
jgi:glycosyltransferase involved in cell wall biosynthesis